ncbi:MAG: class I SAM-dependent methyltransferase [Solirubrobacteraceae bacterium]
MRGSLRLLLSLRVLPWRVARFYWRAHRHARRCGDRFSLDSAARPSELAELLALVAGRRAIVELGTGTAWSAIALALDDRARRIVSYDPSVRPERIAYLKLAGDSARERIELRAEPDSRGPHVGDAAPELLFIDSEHERRPVLDAFAAWRDALAPGAVVVFHDYGHPRYPGVRQAVGELGLQGIERHGLFVWHAA